MIREIHYGTVLDNNDPARGGGLKVRVDTLASGGGVADVGVALLDDFIPPCFPFAGAGVGFFFVPDVGAQVEVEVAADPDEATEDLAARWRAVLYSDVDQIPAEFLSSPTTRGGIKFGSHVLLMDSGEGGALALISEVVRLGEELASHPVLRGDTYNTEEATLQNAFSSWITAFNTYIIAIQSIVDPGAPPGILTGPMITANTTLQTSISSFLGKQNNWLSTKVKTE